MANSGETKCINFVVENDGSLLRVICDTLVQIDITDRTILIPTLCQDFCREYDIHYILNATKLIKNSIVGKKLSLIKRRVDEYEEVENILEDINKNSCINVSKIMDQIDCLKKSLNEFNQLLKDLNSKYEDSVHLLHNLNDVQGSD